MKVFFRLALELHSQRIPGYRIQFYFVVVIFFGLRFELAAAAAFCALNFKYKQCMEALWAYPLRKF